MVLFSNPIETIEDLFVRMLQDLLYVEKQIATNLPTMAETAGDAALRDALLLHVIQTRTQGERLAAVLAMHGQEAKATVSSAIEGILSEATDVLVDCSNVQTTDASMLSAAQAIEHFEIARYGTLIALARQLGRDDSAGVLQLSLLEETAAVARLTDIAESWISSQPA
jgi:ferritin-like metal-binding protein YciE